MTEITQAIVEVAKQGGTAAVVVCGIFAVKDLLLGGMIAVTVGYCIKIVFNGIAMLMKLSGPSSYQCNDQ